MGRLFSPNAPLAAISVAQFINSGDGTNIKPALDRAIAVIQGGSVPRALIIPYAAAGWTVASQVLFNLSDFTLYLYGDVTLSSTTRQTALLFAYDTGAVPAQSLKNVSVIGNGSKVDGNGAAMSFSYTHGDGSDDTSSVKFNYVDGVFVQGIRATNGPLYGLDLRQCRNWQVSHCEFDHAVRENGFQASTDWATQVYGDLTTYGYGVAKDCIAHDNAYFGFTAYNCSGVRFDGCRSYSNRGGYSYEDAFATPDVKVYDGGFSGCSAYNCVEQGFYLTGDGVNIDAACKSWNVRGFVGDNSAGLYMNGVVISNVLKASVGGEHTKNGNAGLAIFNGTSQRMDVDARGKFNDNDGPGVYGRGIGYLRVAAGSEVSRNGLVLVNSAYSPGINVSNSGGATYLQDDGVLKIDGAEIDGNGLGAVDVQYVKTVQVSNVLGIDNCASGSSNGVRVRNATVAKVSDCHLPSANGNQVFGVVIDVSVNRGYENNNSGDGTSGAVTNLGATFAQSIRGEHVSSKTWAPGTVAALSGSTPGVASTTISIGGLDVGDFVQATMSTSIGDLELTGIVTSTGVVTVYLKNFTTAGIAVSSGTLRVLGTRRNGG